MKTRIYLKSGISKGARLLLALFLTCITTQAQQWTPKEPSNIALYKPAKQSSIFEVAAANRAVDGNTSGDWGQRSVTHTNGENNPWWEVDLLGVYDISSITLYNRNDKTERLNNFTIRVSEVPLNGRQGGQVFNNDRSKFTGSKTFNGQARGRYVSVQIEGNGILSLAEVKVTGTLVSQTIDENTNLALGKSTRQSSVYAYSGSNKANDGNTDGNWNNGSVIHTNKDSKAFWEVDLGKNYLIQEVKIFNRTDCCQNRLDNFEIYVTDKPYDDVRGRLDPFFSEEKNFLPNNYKSYYGSTPGRYVRVQLNGNNNLNIAEVQVFGRDLGVLDTNIPQETREVYRISVYNNGLNREWPQASELATAVTEGYNFRDTSEKSSTNWWEVSSEVSTSVSILLHQFDVTVGAKGGGNTTTTNISEIAANIEQSETETTRDEIPVMPNTTVYKLVKFKLVEKPYVYNFNGKQYKFRKVMGRSKPVQDATALVYPFKFDPGFEKDEDEFISKENYDYVLSKYNVEKQQLEGNGEQINTPNQNTNDQNTTNPPIDTNSNSNTQDNSTSTVPEPITNVEITDTSGNTVGYFVGDNGKWEEQDAQGNAKFHYAEDIYNDDPAQIILNDLERQNVKIHLNLETKEVLYEDLNNEPFFIYKIKSTK